MAGDRITTLLQPTAKPYAAAAGTSPQAVGIAPGASRMTPTIAASVSASAWLPNPDKFYPVACGGIFVIQKIAQFCKWRLVRNTRKKTIRRFIKRPGSRPV